MSQLSNLLNTARREILQQRTLRHGWKLHPGCGRFLILLHCVSLCFNIEVSTSWAGERQLIVEIAGPEEIVLAAEEMTCAGRAFDVPDVPASAFRWADGTVTMIASNRQNLRLDGISLDNVRRNGCMALHQSEGNSDPAAFSDQEWLTSLYSEDGRYVLGLIHNEYHGFRREPEDCDTSSQRTLECWYASSTLIESHDGGKTWQRPEAPANVIMSLPDAYWTGMKRAGVFMPKAVGGSDGYLYAMSSLADRNKDFQIGQCLARRVPKPSEPWQVWTGESFETLDVSPYGCAGACTGRRKQCEPVISFNVFAVKRIPSRDEYVAIGVHNRKVVYATSNDLIKWSEPAELFTMPLFPIWEQGQGRPGWYFSILDPKSESRNFDTVGASPYLYFVKFRTTDGALDHSRRDLVRIPLRIR